MNARQRNKAKSIIRKLEGLQDDFGRGPAWNIIQEAKNVLVKLERQDGAAGPVPGVIPPSSGIIRPVTRARSGTF